MQIIVPVEIPSELDCSKCKNIILTLRFGSEDPWWKCKIFNEWIQSDRSYRMIIEPCKQCKDERDKANGSPVEER